MNGRITGKDTAMKFKVMTTIFSFALVAVFVALILSLSPGAASVSASTTKSGNLEVETNCATYSGLAGDFCTVTASNLAEVAIGSMIVYDQAAGIPQNFVDSDVVLVAPSGPDNWAVGHCTSDSTESGVCTFSDGTGPLTGFSARVDVSPVPPGGLFGHFTWVGTYSFSR